MERSSVDKLTLMRWINDCFTNDWVTEVVLQRPDTVSVYSRNSLQQQHNELSTPNCNIEEQYPNGLGDTDAIMQQPQTVNIADVTERSLGGRDCKEKKGNVLILVKNLKKFKLRKVLQKSKDNTVISEESAKLVVNAEGCNLGEPHESPVVPDTKTYSVAEANEADVNHMEPICQYDEYNMRTETIEEAGRDLSEGSVRSLSELSLCTSKLSELSESFRFHQFNSNRRVLPIVSRKSYSFTNERVREIERHNLILMKKIVNKKPTYKANNIEKKPTNPKKLTTLPPIRKVSNAEINRRKQQREINMMNQVLKRKMDAIAHRKPSYN